MNTDATFEQWCVATAEFELEPLRLADAFVLAVCRIEAAAKAGARDPIHAISNGASQSSRGVTKAMFGQLGYNRAQTRIMQRILGGSTSGWPGLIRLYLNSASLSPEHCRYLRRQVKEFVAAGPLVDALALAA